jgi:hypothetical protein
MTRQQEEMAEASVASFHLPARKVMLAAPPITERTEGGLIKSPKQLDEEKQQASASGALVVLTSEEAEESGIFVGNYAYTMSQSFPEFIMDRDGFRFLVYDISAISVLRSEPEEDGEEEAE